jgi:hypothetical protein
MVRRLAIGKNMGKPSGISTKNDKKSTLLRTTSNFVGNASVGSIPINGLVRAKHTDDGLIIVKHNDVVYRIVLADNDKPIEKKTQLFSFEEGSDFLQSENLLSQHNFFDNVNQPQSIGLNPSSPRNSEAITEVRLQVIESKLTELLSLREEFALMKDFLEKQSAKGLPESEVQTLSDADKAYNSLAKSIRNDLEKNHLGEIIAINAETQEVIATGETVFETLSKAKKRFPNIKFYLKKVGSSALCKLR